MVQFNNIHIISNLSILKNIYLFYSGMYSMVISISILFKLELDIIRCGGIDAVGAGMYYPLIVKYIHSFIQVGI